MFETTSQLRNEVLQIFKLGGGWATHWKIYMLLKLDHFPREESIFSKRLVDGACTFFATDLNEKNRRRSNWIIETPGVKKPCLKPPPGKSAIDFGEWFGTNNCWHMCQRPKRGNESYTPVKWNLKNLTLMKKNIICKTWVFEYSSLYAFMMPFLRITPTNSLLPSSGVLSGRPSPGFLQFHSTRHKAIWADSNWPDQEAADYVILKMLLIFCLTPWLGTYKLTKGTFKGVSSSIIITIIIQCVASWPWTCVVSSLKLRQSFIII